MDTEAIRQTYRPDQIHILFVGESPPDGGKFFYVESQMTTHMANVIASVFSKSFKSAEAFLKFFKDERCYLDDLCLTPVNGLTEYERAREVNASIEPYANRIKKYKPQYIIAVLKKIEKQVRQSAHIAQFDDARVFAVPFAGNGQQGRFKKDLTLILTRICEK